MNITLTPELENLINEKVKSGRYDSPGEVIREGLRLLKEQDELNAFASKNCAAKFRKASTISAKADSKLTIRPKN